MFLLAVFHDSIPVEPADFNKNHEDHLKTIIQNKFVDRVVQDVGFVIAFYDFIEIKEAKIYAGDGRAHFKVDFRMVVFHPFIGEILQGIVTGSDSVGLHVSMDFFQDIRIPSVLLREPKGYDTVEKTWSWNYEGYKLQYTPEAPIRFRVTDVHFNKRQRTQQQLPAGAADTPQEPPMVILGSVNEDGLGLAAWWE